VRHFARPLRRLSGTDAVVLSISFGGTTPATLVMDDIHGEGWGYSSSVEPETGGPDEPRSLTQQSNSLNALAVLWEDPLRSGAPRLGRDPGFVAVGPVSDGNVMPDQDLTRVLVDATSRRDAPSEALDRIFAAVYDELRTLARRRMGGERPDHTLQPTALVNEAYLRLVDDSRLEWSSRAHFFGIAAQAMRRVLLDHARRRNTAKRGGQWERLRLDVRELLARDDDVLAVDLDRALDRLRRLHERSARGVELRVFAGLSGAEIAAILGVSRKTVVGDWRFARMWLSAALAGEDPLSPDEARE
jgi:RNA polymerase sigma factor (TIGR02999 family)